MIKVENLSFSYSGSSKPTVKNIDFTIEKGEIFGFLGPSGAGKSTIQKILIGLLKEYSGTAQVLAEEVKNAGSDFYEKIGVAFEFPNFYSKFSALENLQHFQRLYSVDTINPMQLLASVGMEKDAHTKVSAFSKGMKMRLNFCRALLNRPELIFLDEPTSGLDPVNAKILREKILSLKQAGKTIVITTHNMNLAEEICDRVAFIVDGQIQLIDSPQALKHQKGEKVMKAEFKNETGFIFTKTYSLQHFMENEELKEIIRSGSLLSLHSQEASLEEIFIEVTGRSLVS